MAAAPAAQQATVVVVRSAEALAEVAHSAVALAEVVRSLMVEARSAEALAEAAHSLMAEVVHTGVVLTDMVAWEAVDKIIVTAHVPLHSSCAVSRS